MLHELHGKGHDSSAQDGWHTLDSRRYRVKGSQQGLNRSRSGKQGQRDPGDNTQSPLRTDQQIL